MHPFEALYLGSGKVLVDPGSPCATPPHYCRQGGYWSTVAGVLWSGSHPAVVVCRGGSRGDGGELGLGRGGGDWEGEFIYHRSYTTHQHAHLTERGKRERM